MLQCESEYFSQSCVADFLPSGGKTCCFKPDSSQSVSEEWSKQGIYTVSLRSDSNK